MPGLRFSLAIAAASTLVPAAAHAQLLVEGVIHESDTLAPVGGVAVFLVDDASGEVVSPGRLADPAQQGRVTDADGRYRFEVDGPGAVRLSIERPDSRFVFPSADRPPEGPAPLGGIACSTVPCPGGALVDSAEPVDGGRYALRFRTADATSARNNHVPIDRLDRLIRATLDADRARVRRGQYVSFEADFTSRQVNRIDDFEIVLSIPPELRLMTETLRVERRSATSSVAAVTPRQDDLLLRVGPVSLGPDETLRLRVVARAVRIPEQSRSTVRTWLERPGGIVVSNEAALKLFVEGDPTLDQSSIIGRVFCDGDGPRDGWQDEQERGLFGARVYLDTGFYAETDRSGLFHFSGVPPGTHLVKLDEGTLPPPSEVTTPIRQQLYLSPGTPAKIRFGVRCALEEWRRPSRVAVKTASVARVAASGARTIDVKLSAAERRLDVAGRGYQFPRAELRVVGREDGARLFLFDVAPFTPTRWRIHIEEIGADGKVRRAVKSESLTGRGPPPLYVDWRWDRPPNGVYRARLELRVDDLDEAMSPAVDFGAPPRLPTVAVDELERIETLFVPEEGGAFESIDALVARLVEGRPPRVVLVGHWDDGDGAQAAVAKGRALAERLATTLSERGVEATFTAMSRGAEEPLVPNISARLRVRNRRVDVRVGAPVAPPPPPVPPAPRGAPSLLLAVDNQSGEVPLERWSDVNVTIDVDAPATLTATLRARDGGTATIRRVITADWVTRIGEHEPQRIQLEPDAAALVVASTDGAEGRRIDLAPYALDLGDVQVDADAGRVVLRVQPSTRSVTDQWSLALFDSAGTRPILAERSGSGGVDVAELTVTSTIVFSRPTSLALSATFPGGVRATRVLPLPKLEPGTEALRPPASAPRAPVVVVPGARRILDAPIDPVGRTLLVAGPTILTLPLLGLEDLPRAEPPSSSTSTPSPELVPAADVVMSVAPEGQTHSRLAYPIHGTTRPTNVVRINGERVAVDEDGTFTSNVRLDPGDNVVRVETEDPAGNRATFERKVTTSSSSWFLLAMGDAQVGLGGSRLAGSNRHTHIDAGPLSLDGRAVAYGRARVALKDGPFERVEVVGRIDTGQLADPTIRRLEDDPLRLLPAFGDASVEVQETASRYKIDLTVRADDSTLAVGNRTTTLEGLSNDGYFAFRRAGFGVHADLDERFGEHDRTELRGMVGFENEGTRRGRDELTGTGGTIYWLSHRDLVEGSERIALVVRDRDTGFVLERVPQERGVDYEIRPYEGRLVFREPVPYAVSMAQTAINRSVALTGHPIFIEVDYAYLSSGADATTFGVEAKETLFDKLEIFGAVAGENVDDGRHRLYGVGLAYRPTPGSFLEFEYARSSGATNAGRLSTDGGLTYFELSLAERADIGPLEGVDGPFFGALDENAFSLTGQLSIGDLFASRPLEERPSGYVRAYGRKAGLQFSTLGSARQSGRLEGGLTASYDVTPEITARASFDAAVFVTPEAVGVAPTEVDGTFRGLFTAGVTYRSGIHGVGFELAHLHTNPLSLPGSASTTGLSGRYDREVTDDLTLTLGQDALIATDAITNSDISVLGTTVGAAYRLTEALELSLVETVRWNGDNATQLGVRVRGEDGFSSYVAERLAHTGGQPSLVTVVGAEDVVAEGSRSYGELQLGGAFHPTTSRAVLGMDNRWRVADGVDLLLAYERAQLLASTVLPNATEPSPFTAPFGGLAATLGGFGAPVQILPGAVSRDALAVGLVYGGVERLRLSTRVELRVDDGDESAGGRDFRVLGGHFGALWKVTRDVSALGRLTVQHVTDTNADRTYAKAIEGSVGAVFRPRTEDWFTLIVRYTRLDQQRPKSLEDDRRVTEVRDALSVEPIIDTPWNVQLVERVALVSSESDSDLAEVRGLSVLWINRLNARPWDQIEGGVEYRMLVDLDTNTAERGFLFELGYLPSELVRIGVGYNFTRFSDDVLTLTSADASGPFLRVTARY